MKRGYIRLIVLITLVISTLPASSVWAQDGEELTESFVSRDQRVSFNYPVGWAVEEMFSGIILVSSDPAAIEIVMGDSEGVTPMLPDALLLGIVPPPSIAGTMFEGLEPESLEEAALYFQEQVATGSEDSEVGELEEITVGDFDAIQIHVQSSTGEGAIIAVNIDGEYMLVSAIAAVDQYADYEEIAAAILDTITYSVPEGSVTFTSNDETLSVEYPGAWHAGAVVDGLTIIWNGDITSGLFSEEPLTEGRVVIYIYSPMMLAFFSGTTLAEALTEFADLAIPDDEQEVSDPVEMTFGELDAMRVDFESEIAQGYALAVDYGGGAYLYFMITTAAGELAAHEEIITEILESVEYTPLAP